MAVAVVAMTTASTHTVGRVDQTRKPYSSVRLIQMKWNGTVSQREKTTIATRLAMVKAPHATSTQANGHRGAGRPRGQCSPRGQCGPGGRGGQVSPAGTRSVAASWCRRPPGTASGGKLVALTAHRLDQVEAELGAEPAHADVHHVRARVEVISPDRGEQLALAHRLACVLHQL